MEEENHKKTTGQKFRRQKTNEGDWTILRNTWKGGSVLLFVFHSQIWTERYVILSTPLKNNTNDLILQVEKIEKLFISSWGVTLFHTTVEWLLEDSLKLSASTSSSYFHPFQW